MKIDRRPSLQEYNEIYNACMSNNYYDPNDPFLFIKAKAILYKKILFFYKEKTYLTKASYFLSLILKAAYQQAINIKHITSGTLQLWSFTQFPKYNDQKYITCSKGIDRAKSYFFDENDIFDMPVRKDRIKLSFDEKIQVIKLMKKYKMSSFWHVAQYYILKKSSPKINAPYLLMEDGMDFVGGLFAQFFRSSVTEVIYTHCSPHSSPALNYMADKIVVNNLLSYKQMLKKNFKVEFGESTYVMRKKIKFPYNQPICIGYGPEIGNSRVNYNDKKIIDVFMKNYASENNANLLISLHPQEKKLNFKNYKNFFNNINTAIRHKETIEEYFLKIDIFVTWWSTMIFHSLSYDVPVILLDFFDDKQADDLVDLANGMVVKVTNLAEFESSVELLRGMPDSKKEKKFNAVHENFYKCSRVSFD